MAQWDGLITATATEEEHVTVYSMCTIEVERQDKAIHTYSRDVPVRRKVSALNPLSVTQDLALIIQHLHMVEKLFWHPSS
jgi:hypothetical protein